MNHQPAPKPGTARTASSSSCTRRDFLRWSATLAGATPFALSHVGNLLGAEAPPPNVAGAKVAIVACRGYGAEVHTAFKEAFDLLGGIGSLVKNKTVTVKLNLTGTNFTPVFDRPVGETYMTHFSTALALTKLLLDAGARRVRLVESTNSKASLEATVGLADWDVEALRALGRVEFENTRNLGAGSAYAELKVPGNGLMFSSLRFNHAYAETDVMVSLCKLKQHITAGVTLSMKNLFGITPNALYGDEAGNEDATAGRGVLHSPGPGSSSSSGRVQLPGFKLKEADEPREPGVRVPRIVTDICAARPIHLSIIDGITSMSGGEGPWCGPNLKATRPGVLIAGLNPVSTDAVGTAVMGFADPRAKRGVAPFENCENHLLLAEGARLGTADLTKIDVRGLTIQQAVYRYAG
jgi:uncharacterized protein (DUF362 family)